MTDINLKTLSPDTSLPTTGFLFGADSQATSSPSVYSTQTVATTLLGSTSLTGDTLTASAPVLNLTQTWNNGAVTFTGMAFNAAGTSDANSAAASLLMDLQVNTTSKFKVSKAGAVTTTGNLAISGTFQGANYFALQPAGFTNAIIMYDGGASGVGMVLTSGANIRWSDNATNAGSGTGDVVLTRRGIGNLRFGNADAASPVAQTLSVQSIVGGLTGTPNLSAAAYPFTITGAQGTGTGAGGSIVFQVAPAGGSGTAQNALVAALTIDTTNAIFNRGGGSSVRSEGEGFYALSSGNNKINVSQYGLRLTSDLALTWSNSTTNCASVIDTYLTRDAANTLAQRNGVNAQTFNVYNTYTDASNYERGFVRWSSNEYQIGNEALGTGTTRPVGIYQGATQIAQFSTGIIYINRALSFQPDNTYDVGGSGGNRPRSVYVGTSITPGRGVTVAGLPTPSTGMIARVTDANAPVIGTTVAGGGAAYALVNYNGANWTVIGV